MISEEQKAPEVTASAIQGTVQAGMARLMYHEALLCLVRATSDWAKAVEGTVQALEKLGPSPQSQGEEDAAGVAVQEILRLVVVRAPGIGAVMRVAAGSSGGMVPV